MQNELNGFHRGITGVGGRDRIVSELASNVHSFI